MILDSERWRDRRLSQSSDEGVITLYTLFTRKSMASVTTPSGNGSLNSCWGHAGPYEVATGVPV